MSVTIPTKFHQDWCSGLDFMEVGHFCPPPPPPPSTNRGTKDASTNRVKEKIQYSANIIATAKDKYLTDLGKKLNDPLLGPKAYWSILNKFLNKKKIPLIPPIDVNGVYVTDTCQKADLFNEYFADQCTVIDNTSTLPEFSPKTNASLNHINITENEILSIIRSLNHNKVHGWDGISIRMIQICDDALVIPLKIIFEH